MLAFNFDAVEYHSTIDPDEKLSTAPFSVEGGYMTIRHMGTKLRQRIKAARLHAGLTLEKLGELCGVSKSAASMWETANEKKATQPTLENLKRISQVTGAPIDWLMDDSADIDANWKEPAELIQFPGQESKSGLTPLAVEAANIISRLAPEDQLQIIHYLRIHSQTKAK